MFFPESRVRVWLYARATDMRKSFTGLSALAKHALGEEPGSGDLFVFINRRRTYMEVLYFDRGGYCLWSKRLEQEQFHYPTHQGGRSHSTSRASSCCSKASMHAARGVTGNEARRRARYNRSMHTAWASPPSL